MEKKFEFTSEYDFVSKLNDMYVALSDKGIHIPTTMESNGSLIPLFGKLKITKSRTFFIRIGRFGKWKNRNGEVVVLFNTEEEAEKFLNGVVKRHYKGSAQVEADDNQPGSATYYLADSTVEALQNLDKKWICLYSEWSSSLISKLSEEKKEIIINLRLQDEYDNAVLSCIKESFLEAWNTLRKKELDEAQREERRKAAEARAAEIEAERMKFPLYKIFSTIERWDEDDGYFNNLLKETSWIREEAEKNKAHRVEMEKLRKADPEPADGGFFGDPGWYDE